MTEFSGEAADAIAKAYVDGRNAGYEAARRNHQERLDEAQATIDDLDRRRVECLLRLAETYETLEAISPIQDTYTQTRLREVRMALKGDPGDRDPSEYQERRRNALNEHGPRLQWGKPVILEVEGD